MKNINLKEWIVNIFRSHMIISIIILALDSLLIYIWYQSNLIIDQEVYSKNMEYGRTKCAEVANDLDNIIYLGENVVHFIDMGFHYLHEEEDFTGIKEQLLDQTFHQINKKANYFENLYFADNDGSISAGNKVYEALESQGRPWYDKALQSKELVITSPYKDSYTENDVITISKSIGVNSGVIGLDISQIRIYNIIKEKIQNDKIIKSGFIINPDGIIIARTDNKHIGQPIISRSIKNSDKLKPYYDEILTKSSGQIMFDQEGYAYGMIYQKTASDWRVFYTVDKKVIGSDTIVLKRQIFLYTILSFILLNTVIIIYYYRRQIAIKLKERAESAEKDLIKYKNHLEHLVEERTEEIMSQGKRLEELNKSIIDNLADIVEFRDLESGQHIKRIKKYVKLMIKKATELYPEYEDFRDKIDKVCEASALHDIGKIGISDTILLKPAKLTFEEFEEMKKHTIIGAELASKILEKYDKDLKEFGYQICRSHHERCDGKGYPDGLKEEEIPFCAQIVGIADVYDALSEKRVYKEPYSHERAIEMIINGECGRFSDKILNCLKLVESEFKQIRENTH